MSFDNEDLQLRSSNRSSKSKSKIKIQDGDFALADKSPAFGNEDYDDGDQYEPNLHKQVKHDNELFDVSQKAVAGS